MTRKINPSLVLTILLALAGAGFAAYIDMRASEVQAVVMVLMVAGLILGALQPRYVLLWALILGIGVVLAEVIAYWTGFVPAGYIHSNAVHPGAGYAPSPMSILQSAVSFIFALIGAGVGAGVRAIFRRPAVGSSG